MFTQRALDFLYHNRLNNSSEWYRQHKADYEAYLLQPFKQLVTDLAPTMLAIDDKLIVEPKVDRSISRIYRDMRLVRDGYRYRDKMWALFVRDKKLYNGLPAFYFELSPYGFSYGCGYYKADAESNNNLYALIRMHAREYLDAVDCVNSQNTFSLCGDPVKPKADASCTEKDVKWLSLSNIGLIVNSKDYALLTSPDLSAVLAEQFKQIAPFYRFLMKAEAMRTAAK